MTKLFSLSFLFKVVITTSVWLEGLRLATSSAYAQVVINEVHPAPSSGAEWVELYNPSSQAVNLQGWTLEDQLSSPSVMYSFSASDSVGAGGYLVVEVGSKLNNSGDGVTLKNQTNQAVSQMSYTSSQSNMSWARQPSGTGEFVLVSPTRGSENPAPSATPTSTPTSGPSATPTPTPSATPTSSPIPSPSPSPTSTPSVTPTPTSSPTATPVVYPTNLVLSEILACPETGQSEWIEVFNPDPVSYTLSNWKMKDSTGNTRNISATLPAQSYTALLLSSAILNNAGDSVSLERPDGVKLFTTQFGACESGMSMILHQGTWQLTSTITKDAVNIFTGNTGSEDDDQASTENSSNTHTSSSYVAGSLSTGTSSDTFSELSSSLLGTTSKTTPISTQYLYKLPSLVAQVAQNISSSSATVTSDSAALSSDLHTHFEEASGSSTLSSSSSPIEPKAPFISKNTVFLISMTGIVSACIGSYGIYQWYTEYHARKDLEAL